MERSARMDDADFGSSPAWKSNNVMSWIWMQQAMHTELNDNSCFRKKWDLSFTSKRPLSANCVASLETEVSVSPAIDTFWKWLKEEGVVSAKTPVKPSVVPEGLGLVALKDISRNEVVLQVPKRLWINPDVVAASKIGKGVFG
ncbi:hypothetical protein JHK87_047693 [Glycine soja]|nr:hypothetical protein JHK87_047693 [Glycine soja]